MKKFASILTLAVSLAALFVPSARAAVLISELCDPRNDYLTDRYIEIWNAGPASVDLAGWQVVAVGNTNEIFTWNLSGVMAPGAVLVCGDNSTADTFPVDFALAAWSDNNATWNGKVGDGARLKDDQGNTVDDVVVGGTVFENQHLVRNEGVDSPSPTFDLAQWTAAPVDIPSEATPGIHFALPSDGPVIGAITTLPASPQPGEDVDVRAVVTDATAPITAVILSWGTASGSLPNDIVMTYLGASTFETVTPIPGQTNGTTVYYRVTADNDVPLQSVSGEFDYLVYVDVEAPVVQTAFATSPTTVELTFDETLDATTAFDAANYTLSGGTVGAADPVPGQQNMVTLTVSYLAVGPHALTIDGVEDLLGNATANLVVPFTWYGGNIPVGYYDTAEGLTGPALRSALLGIVDGHTSIGYSSVWSAFYSTDDKPNGKVWDMYSDVPGGTPPYEYTFGVDQGGSAGSEGSGYNREHSWPSSWYGATSPMYTDLFVVYPTDNEVNNKRSNHPFGEVDSPTWTSLNGSMVGACTYPGYTGTVFEPIDEYKGDFARAYFYMTVRYYGQDAGWPGSGMTDGADLRPWAEAMLLEWHAADPVSMKEIDRNEAVYAIQDNRNPFIDRPDFVLKLFRPELSPVPVALRGVVLMQNVPNPFNPSTTIAWELEETAAVQLQIFDLQGRLIRTLYRGQDGPGRHSEVWLGRDQEGRDVAAGMYFYRLQAGTETATKRMLLVK